MRTGSDHAAARIAGEADEGPARTEASPFCPLCGSSEPRRLFEAWDRCFRLPGRFGVVQCRACDMLWLSPRPTLASLPSYYPESDYYSYNMPQSASAADRAPTSVRGRVQHAVRAVTLDALGYPVDGLPPGHRLVAKALPRVARRFGTYWHKGFPRHVAGGRALDVGCGTGGLLQALRDHGWQVDGIELNVGAAKVAAERGLPVLACSVDDAPYAAASFDFVHMSHVIEHLPDPAASLRRVVEWLKPGGLVYIETPNVASIDRRLAGPHWFDWEVPRHLVFFAPRTLDAMLAQVGLRKVEMTTEPFHTFAWEDTYRREERAGRPLRDADGGPVLRWTGWPRAAAAVACSLAVRAVRPLSQDILMCWARKA